MANIVLGGGISGLSAAYYLSKHSRTGVKLIEASGRVGGWIQSVKNENGKIFDQGPRTIRRIGLNGDNTLKLTSDLGLESEVIPILSDSAAGKNRMIFVNGKFCMLPKNVSDSIKILPPFQRPLILSAIKDLLTPKKVATDDSVYDFVARRFGKDLADYLVSPLICGIVAGDAKELSVKLIFKNQFEHEQKYRSVLIGTVKTTYGNIEELKRKKLEQDSYNCDLTKRARLEEWLFWSLNDGLETLPKALHNYLKGASDVDINLNSECKKIEFKNDSVVIMLENGKTESGQQLYSSLPSRTLAKLLPDEHSFLKQELSAIPYVTVGVVNLEFEGDIVPIQAFGYLIPPIEKNPVLGVVFDSVSIPQGGNTILTIMMGGRWFKDHFGDNPDKKTLLDIAVNHVKKNFPTNADPISSRVSILRDCIPQYVVGHFERIDKINQYISDHRLPISLIGNSYNGVSVNDAIYSAKQSVEKELQRVEN